MPQTCSLIMYSEKICWAAFAFAFFLSADFMFSLIVCFDYAAICPGGDLMNKHQLGFDQQRQLIGLNQFEAVYWSTIILNETLLLTTRVFLPTRKIGRLLFCVQALKSHPALRAYLHLKGDVHWEFRISWSKWEAHDKEISVGVNWKPFFISISPIREKIRTSAAGFRVNLSFHHAPIRLMP